MKPTRTHSFVRSFALALLGASVLVGAAGCRRSAPPTPVAAPGKSPDAPKPVLTPEQAQDNEILRAKKAIPNYAERVEEALAVLAEAQKLKAETYDNAPTPEDKKKAGAAVKALKNKAGNLWELLEDEARNLGLNGAVWTVGFGSEIKRWDRAAKGLERIGM